MFHRNRFRAILSRETAINRFIMDNLTLSIEDLYEETKDRAFSVGAFSREEWFDTIEEVLDGKRELMEIDDDDDWQYIIESLQSRYDDFSKDVSLM